MMQWLAVPLGLQALAMLVDELHFHRQRGLPRWERIGHPLDTLSVLACYALALSASPTQGHLIAYALVAAGSCLLVTKDELVHAERCKPMEQWLHALLFMLHPIVLGSAAFLWVRQERTLLWLSASLTAAFGAYQALYWNVPWTKRLRPRSTMPFTTSSVNAGTPPTTTPSPCYVPNRGSETRG
ncbi:MAG TPA: hypothetical protein VIW29_00915 [Polyangiaceae bacterium]